MVLISVLTNYGFEISEGKGSHVKAYYSHKGYEWRVHSLVHTIIHRMSESSM
jgi:predicted RNA binding protein YcfA (HicA-like mRNA interferase family)